MTFTTGPWVLGTDVRALHTTEIWKTIITTTRIIITTEIDVLKWIVM
jgi:hypothetical protein